MANKAAWFAIGSMEYCDNTGETLAQRINQHLGSSRLATNNEIASGQYKPLDRVNDFDAEGEQAFIDGWNDARGMYSDLVKEYGYKQFSR